MLMPRERVVRWTVPTKKRPRGRSLVPPGPKSRHCGLLRTEDPRGFYRLDPEMTFVMRIWDCWQDPDLMWEELVIRSYNTMESR